MIGKIDSPYFLDEGTTMTRGLAPFSPRRLLLLGCLLLVAAEPQAPPALRYLRPAKDKFVLESLVTTQVGRDGTTYVSLTDRGAEKMTLTLRHGLDKRLTSAEVLQETAAGKKTATLTVKGNKAQLQRGDDTETIDLVADPVVTTAPDWSDIFQLVRRYDGTKRGRQEFAGLWIHPSKPTLKLTFTIEPVGNDAVTVNNQPLMLERYQVRLRSGAYLVWADSTRRVYKLMPPGAKASPVVLEGYEEATRGLGP